MAEEGCVNRIESTLPNFSKKEMIHFFSLPRINLSGTHVLVDFYKSWDSSKQNRYLIIIYSFFHS
jgi:hypothetical protein